MQEAKIQDMGAKLCTFSRDYKHKTYAEAYEISTFRQYYLNRLNGPRSTQLSPAQWDFADYCAMREDTEQKFFQDSNPTGFRPTQLAMQVVSNLQEKASSSNEQPMQTDGANQIAFLKNFNRQNVSVSAASRSSRSSSDEQPEQRSEPSQASAKGRVLLNTFKVGPSSNDDDSTCSFSVIEEQ